MADSRTAHPMNFLLGNNQRMRFLTDLAAVFDAFEGREREIDWILGDLEFNFYPPGLRPAKAPQLFRGALLSEIVRREAGRLQFIWGALIAVRPGSETEDTCRRLDIAADGYTGIWSSSPKFKHAMSVCEIVC